LRASSDLERLPIGGQRGVCYAVESGADEWSGSAKRADEPESRRHSTVDDEIPLPVQAPQCVSRLFADCQELAPRRSDELLHASERESPQPRS
jgi:hypothetical protein